MKNKESEDKILALFVFTVLIFQKKETHKTELIKWGAVRVF